MPVPAPTAIWIKPSADHIIRLDAFDHVCVIQTGATWAVKGYVGMDPHGPNPSLGNPSREIVIKEGFATQVLAQTYLTTIATQVSAITV